MYVRPRYRLSKRSERDRREAPEAPERRRSHAAAFPALLLLGAGLYLGTISVVVEAILGLALLSGAFGLIGSRVNPLSVGFYLTTKPSWSAIGTVFLSGLLLVVMTYIYYVKAWGPVLPHLPGL